MILVIASPNSYAAKRLVEEAKKFNIPLEIISAATLAKGSFKIDVKKYKALYIRSPYVKGKAKFLAQIIKLAKNFKIAGKKVVDANIANGQLGQGKWEDYLKLAQANLPIPGTMKMRSRAFSEYGHPFILKWQFGMGSKNVFLIGDDNQFKKTLPLHPKKEWLVQEFVKADCEYRVITVGYKALPVVLKYKLLPSGFGIDYYSGKAIKSSSIPKIIAIAQKSAKLLGRELSKIDILQKGNNIYILEVNRFPGLETFEELTKYNVIKRFLAYLNL